MKVRFILAFLVLATPMAGQNFRSANASAEDDLRQAVAQYRQLQEEIKTKKIPLSEELTKLESELVQKRREVERIQRIRDNRAVQLADLEKRVEGMGEQITYVSNLLADYTARFEQRLHPAEEARYAETLEAVKLANESTQLERTEKVSTQVSILGLGLDRFGDVAGGSLFEQKAATPSGRVREGTFVIVGPLVYFSAGEAADSGISLQRSGETATVAPLPLALAQEVVRFADAGSGELPMDVTIGSALAIEQERETLWEHIQKGGIWIWPILGFAVIATLVSVFKLFEILGVKLPPAGALHNTLKLINDGKVEEAKHYTQGIEGPAGAMLHDGVVHSDEDKELVEEVMYERILEVQPKLERLLPFIAVTAATAPLMGLLGTVTGMINTFKLITIFGTGDAQKLSSGISEALVTTEFGLIVAIPALIMHALLSRGAARKLATLERTAVAFVNGLKRKN